MFKLVFALVMYLEVKFLYIHRLKYQEVYKITSAPVVLKMLLIF